MTIRRARDEDVEAMCAVDEEARREFIRRSVHKGAAYVALGDTTVVGYAVFEHTFFERGFISMLMVDPMHRRAGVGAAMVRHIEGLCQSERIFTSTNRSNQPMQALLRKLGYRHSGTVEDLDPDDPELFFSRRVR
ncbi:MAG: GNAT family N-acetyltransferase [Myxococcota bacterium]